MTFPSKVVNVVFLCVPLPVGRIHNIVSPAIWLCISYCVLQLTKFNLNSVISVMWATCPSHQRWLIVAIRFEIHLPIFTNCFVEWMAVNVLLLRHINTSNSISVLLGVPRSIPVVSCRWALHIKFRPFVNSNLLRVHMSVSQVVSWYTYTHSLNCTMLEFSAIRRSSAGCAPNIVK